MHNSLSIIMLKPAFVYSWRSAYVMAESSSVLTVCRSICDYIISIYDMVLVCGLITPTFKARFHVTCNPFVYIKSCMSHFFMLERVCSMPGIVCGLVGLWVRVSLCMPCHCQ